MCGGISKVCFSDYVGHSSNVVYYDVFLGSDGQYWWSADISLDYHNDFDVFDVGVGPYDTAERAEQAARDAAVNWFIFNGINI